jgi:hypothetical protein
LLGGGAASLPASALAPASTGGGGGGVVDVQLAELASTFEALEKLVESVE